MPGIPEQDNLDLGEIGRPADPRLLMIAVLPDLRGYARFLARDAAHADDLVQDAVVRALAAIGQFQTGSSIRAWLFTILRHVFFEQSRRRKTERAAIEQSTPPERSVAAAQSGPLDVRDLNRALFGLPPLLREALVLVGVQGLDYAEAAAICGTPVGTIKARVSRARRELARRLAPHDQAAIAGPEAVLAAGDGTDAETEDRAA